MTAILVFFAILVIIPVLQMNFLNMITIMTFQMQETLINFLQQMVKNFVFWSKNKKQKLTQNFEIKSI
jgi:hypothetical protein